MKTFVSAAASIALVATVFATTRDIRPEATDEGSIGTAMYKWDSVFSVTGNFENVAHEMWYQVSATESTSANGTKLANLITELSTAGDDAVVFVEPGIYDLSSTLTISNCTIKLIGMGGATCGRLHNEQSGIIYIDVDQWQQCTITGNVTIASTALGSVVQGFNIIGNVSAPQSAIADRLTPSSLKNCYISGAVASNESSCISMYGCFVEGSVCQDGTWGGTTENCSVMGDNSYSLMDGTGKAGDQYFRNCWIGGSDNFGMSSGNSRLAFYNSSINSDGAFYSSSGDSVVYVRHCQFFGTPGTWAGVSDSSLTEFFSSMGISSSITNHTATKFNFSTDENGTPIE